MENSRQIRRSRPYKISESSKVYKSVEHSSFVLQSLNEQRHCNFFCDVVLIVGEQKIPAHRNVLAVCSEYFHSMFTTGMREACQKEVELFGASSVGLNAIVDFLYGCELSLDGGNIDYILETAHLLQLWEVVDFCCDYLENEVSEENYLYLQELASIFSLKRLDSYIDSFITKNFGTLSFTLDFSQNIPIEKLCHYLGSSDVQQESEPDLLKAALQWLTHHPERANKACLVLENIHFPLIPRNDLLHWVEPAICSLLPGEPSCKDFVEEAVNYHHNITAQPLLQNKRTAIRTNGEKLVVVGGEVSDHCLELSDDMYFLDPKTGHWVREMPLPARRSHHCVAVLGGFIFLAGGSFSRDNGGDAASSLLYRYDPRCRQWIKLASMKQHRVDFYLAALKGMLVAVGGRNEARALSSVETYSPEKDTWSYIAGLPRFTYGHAGAVHDELIYISGGHDYQIGPYRKNLLCYDFQTDTWEERRPMITARGWHSMCTLQDDIYAIGGSDDSLETMTRFDILGVESYNPQCNQWTRVSSLLQANSESGVATWEGKIYILGGYSWEETVFSRTVQVYDKGKNKWHRGADLSKAVAGASACVCTLKPRPDHRKKKSKPQRHLDQGR